MATIVINRLVGYGELRQIISIAKRNDVAPDVLKQLDGRLDAYLVASLWQSGIEFVGLFIVIGILANRLVAPIKALCHALEGIERGDLTHQVANTSLDEVGFLERSFNSMLTNLTSIMVRIDSSGKQMAQSAHQIGAISHEIAEVGAHERARADEVTRATEQLHQSSGAVAELAESAAKRALETESRARAGVETVQQNIERMDKTVEEVNRASNEVAVLTDASQKIVEIVSGIRTIAEQTNLLALNAAIEAARAGEQGRGFAVVADEVRNLASRTTKLTAEISDIIMKLNNQVAMVSSTMKTVVERVHTTQNSARDSRAIIEDMTTVVTETTAANHKIQDVSQQQVRDLARLKSDQNNLFQTLQENSAKVQTTATISDDLFSVTQGLGTLLAKFSFQRDSTANRLDHEKRNAPRLQNHLRVHVHVGELVYEAVSRDFSMTGIQLRMKQPLEKGAQVALRVFVPHNSLTEYQAQLPLIIRSAVLWRRQDGDHHLCGFQFKSLTPDQKQGMEQCFDYFNKQPYYSDEETAAAQARVQRH